MAHVPTSYMYSTCRCCAGDLLKLLMPEGTSRVAASDLEERTERLSRLLRDEKRITGSGAGPDVSRAGGSATQQRGNGEDDEEPTLRDGFWEVRSRRIRSTRTSIMYNVPTCIQTS